MLNSAFFVYLFFLLSSLLLYYNTQDGRLSSDFYNWVYTYEKSQFSDILTCFGYPGLHYFYHLPFYFAYQLIGLNAIGWHILFIGLHALNGLLLFKWLKQWFPKYNWDEKIAIIPTLFFVFSPYQTEVVSWGACIHYLIMCSFLLSSLIFLFRYFDKKSKLSLFAFHGFFVLSLFCMEQSFLFPVLYVLFAFVFRNYYKISFKTIGLKIIIPQVMLFVVYFSLSQLIVGQLIGHYGAETHLNFDLKMISDHLFINLGKFIFFFRFIPQSIDTIIHTVWFTDVAKVFVGIGAISVMLFMYFKKKASFFSSKIVLIIALLIGFVLVLGPTLNLAHESDWRIQTDRYTYVASPFIVVAIFALIQYLPKRIKTFVIVGFLGLSLFSLWQCNLAWRENGQLKKSILAGYPHNEEQPIYLLNLPDNHLGAHLFRNGLAAALDLENNTELKENRFIYSIADINTTTIQDSVSVLPVINGYKIEAMHWGRWLHDLKFQDSLYQIENQWELGFDILHFNNKESSLYYLQGGNWKKLE